ncbi:hypothetical protein HMPREF0577_2065 [Mobiluncus mulieris ATCC 35243]|nr:hypothetical protein HMPREF0577_2065 [Mobiluncus mulieris ATCC 35243]
MGLTFLKTVWMIKKQRLRARNRVSVASAFHCTRNPQEIYTHGHIMSTTVDKGDGGCGARAAAVRADEALLCFPKKLRGWHLANPS